jgi:hypothetical protein
LLEQQEKLQVLQGSDRRLIWVPARRTLKHAIFTVPKQLSSRKRTSALELKISAWSPFHNTRFSAIWSDNVASVFAWDHDALSERISENGYIPSECEIVPEAFIRAPEQNSVRLVACDGGVEAQVWEDGFLRASRWWSTIPKAQEWALFARTTGSTVDTIVPGLSEPNWLESPWHVQEAGASMINRALKNERILVGAAAILLAPCIYYTTQWLTYAALDIRIKREITIIEANSRTVRADRSRALSSLERAEDLIALNRYPHQLEILSRAHSLLQGHAVTLSNWDYDDGLLEFGLESKQDMDARVFISDFERDPLFTSVSSGTRGERLTLRMSVLDTLEAKQ